MAASYNISLDEQSYVRTQSYDDKVSFQPDKIVVPPPMLDFAGGKPGFNVANVQDFGHVNDSCGSPSFMQSIRSLHKLELHHTMLSWRYEHRRQAQPILPFMYLGPSTMAQSSDFIKTTGITLLVAVRSAYTATRLPKYLNPSHFPSAKSLETAMIDLDTPYELVRNLRPLIKLMNDHLEKSCIRYPIRSVNDIGARILIFCESGNERSTVVICAYLMVVYGVDAITAIQVVQSQRFCINVKDEMKTMLMDVESLLVAERQVAAAADAQEQHRQAMMQSSSNVAPVLSLNKSSKRSIDRAYDSDEEMGDDTGLFDQYNGNGRIGSAPFADSNG